VYEWICGTTPFNGTFVELYSQHLNVAPPSLREKVPGLSPATEQVILKALAKDPRQRFARVQDFVDALDQARQASYLYSQTGPTSVPTLPDSNVQRNEENTPTMLRVAPVSQISQPSGTAAVPPAPTIGEDEEDIPTLISGGHRVIQETNGHEAVQKEGTSKNKHQGPSRRMVVFLIGLVIVVVAGSIAFFASGLLRGKGVNQTFSNTGQSTTSYVPPSYSPMFGFNTLHTHFNPDESIISSTNVTGLTNYWTALTGSLINSSPVVANGVAFVSSTDHELYAFDATTGKKLWTALNTTAPSDRGSFIYSTPVVVNGVVYIGSTDHHLYALNARTGKILWTAATGDAIFSSAAVVNGKVYIGSDDHKLYAFNASGCGGQPTCTSLWTATTGSNIVSSPAVVNGVVYAGSWDHKLYAFDANTGNTLWTARVSWKISSSPAVVNGLIYVGSEAGDGLFYVYKASGCGQTTCQPIWVDAAGGWIDSSPAVANDMVYIGSHDNKLYAFKASGCGATLCSPTWTQPTGGPIESAPAVANGVIYVGSWDGKLYAFDAGTGAPLWSYQTGAKITASPTVVNGVVYISSNDHKLYAFHLPGAS
jgi:outer membrane protein assembly factor BamB